MKTAKVTHQKRAFQQLRGLWIEWKDTDLLGGRPPGDGAIGHSNPVYRLSVKRIWRDYSAWLVEKQRMYWRMTVQVVFRHDNQEEQIELSTEAMGTISEISECLYKEQEEVMREAQEKGYAHQFSHANYRIECLGHNKPAPQSAPA